MATVALFGIGVVVTTFMMLAFMMILGGNFVFNGALSTVGAALVFALTYFVLRYFTREIWDNGCLRDEIHISFLSYFMMLVVGSVGMWGFGPNTIPESMNSMLLSFACIASVFIAASCAWLLEIADDPNED